ncbi:MAG: hypothetical protein QME12_02675 [Nanoarchaeota archaeon]|nr:hypothetical protein [Nanoarchaeota archaeon]
MKKHKQFDECIYQKTLIKTGIKDRVRAKDLLALAGHREQFWKEANLAGKYPSLYLEGHYEIIKELCTAILAAEGWNALDHECMFAYIREKEDIAIDFDYLLELKGARNDIGYRGLMITSNIWEGNKLIISLTIRALKEYLSRLLL